MIKHSFEDTLFHEVKVGALFLFQELKFILSSSLKNIFPGLHLHDICRTVEIILLSKVNVNIVCLFFPVMSVFS